MIERFEKYLADLTCLPGLAGHEQQVAKYMKAGFEAAGLAVEIDTFGNCIAKKEGSDPDAPRLMVFAHMDSLGFLVRYIEDNGFLRIERLGGIPEKALPSVEISVQRRDGSLVPGVIANKQHHVTPAEEKYTVQKYMELFVDIGAKSAEEVRANGIDVGSPLIYKPKYTRLKGTRAAGTFMDNRTGCASLLLLADELRDVNTKSDIYLVGTVQEEFNLRGAMMAARTVKPDLAIGVDGGAASDIPEMRRGAVRLGSGPLMSYYNFHGRGTLNGTIPHPAMVRLMEESAGRAGIAFQKNASIGGLTDASYLQLEQTGVMCVDIGAPRRYSHSPAEVVDLKDSVALVAWVKAAASADLGAFDWSRNW